VKIDGLIERDRGVGASALLLTPIHPSAWLERHAQIHFAICPDSRSERHPRHCPNLRGPTRGL